jgi:hypothetical protein
LLTNGSAVVDRILLPLKGAATTLTGFRRVGRQINAMPIFSCFFAYSMGKIGGYKPFSHQKSPGRGKNKVKERPFFSRKKHLPDS